MWRPRCARPHPARLQVPAACLPASALLPCPALLPNRAPLAACLLPPAVPALLPPPSSTQPSADPVRCCTCRQPPHAGGGLCLLADWEAGGAGQAGCPRGPGVQDAGGHQLAGPRSKGEAAVGGAGHGGAKLLCWLVQCRPVGTNSPPTTERRPPPCHLFPPCRPSTR